jgi:hypothetical protein
LELKDMQLGTELLQQVCARCQKKLTVPAVYRDNDWLHRTCWEQGARQFAEAMKISAQVRTMPDLCAPMVFFPQPERL